MLPNLVRGLRARHQMMVPVTDSSAGMIPPRKMTICHTGPMPVPSCQRRMVRASVSGCGGGGGEATAVESATGTSALPPFRAKPIFHSAF